MRQQVITGLASVALAWMVGGCRTDAVDQRCGHSRQEADDACDGCPSSERATAHPDSRNWRSLFNLKLDNAVFPEGVWRIDEQGDLVANQDQAIWTVRDYENFVLDLEYRCDPGANSGVVIYCSDPANWIPNSVEVQILDDHHLGEISKASHYRNGGLFGHVPPRVNASRAPGEWNRMTITAQGQRVQVAVNGEVTVDADLSQWTSAKTNPDGSEIPPWLSRPKAELPTRGRIGFQGKHGASGTAFRFIRIREL